jgi:TolB protein
MFRTSISTPDHMKKFISIAYLLFVAAIAFAQSANYKIVYNVLEDREKDNYEVYSMNMDGTGKKNLTNTPGVEWVYYAYENKVYYISDIDTCHRCYFLYEMDADGNNKRRITDLQLEDSWMGSRNKGTEMIVTGQQLFLVDIKTGKYQQLSNDTVSYKNDPVFSPDGNEIILRYRPDRKLRQIVFDELWLLDSKAQPIRQLTNFPKADTTTPWFEYHAGPPQWNSKHRFISYMSRQNRQTQIYATSLDGKKQWQLTKGELSSGWHAWSPDGEWLVMDRSTNEGKNFDIYLMHYATGKITRLSDDPKTEQAPVFVKKN